MSRRYSSGDLAHGILADVPRPVTGFRYLDEPGTVLAFAHRGGAGHPDLGGLENTRHAFEHAVALGYGYLETDVHATRDGVLLAFHDDALDRVSDVEGLLADLSHAEVSRALVGGREPVPTLVELLDEFPDARFNIDLKSDAAVQALADLVVERDAWDRVLVASFSPRRLRRFRRMVGRRVPTAGHPLEVMAFRALPSGRLARWLCRGGPAALQVPHRRGRLTVVTPGFVRRAHAAGVHVHVWTVDEPAEMRELLDRGVDGLITDRTDTLKDVLLERGQWAGEPR